MDIFSRSGEAVGGGWPAWAQPLLVVLVDSRARAREELVRAKKCQGKLLSNGPGSQQRHHQRQHRQVENSEFDTTRPVAGRAEPGTVAATGTSGLSAAGASGNDSLSAVGAGTTSSTSESDAAEPFQRDELAIEAAAATVRQLGGQIRARKLTQATKVQLQPLLTQLRDAKSVYEKLAGEKWPADQTSHAARLQQKKRRQQEQLEAEHVQQEVAASQHASPHFHVDRHSVFAVVFH
eukprot:COSAG05_NODE_188_length_14697_cov_11.861145_16_plen_236_part_00